MLHNHKIRLEIQLWELLVLFVCTAETVLWTNSSLTSAFDTTTITLSNFSSYEALKVYYRYSTSDATESYVIVKIDTAGPGSGHLAYRGGGIFINNSTYKTVEFVRYIAFTTSDNTKLTISSARKFNGTEAQNGYGIPIKICGIK